MARLRDRTLRYELCIGPRCGGGNTFANTATGALATVTATPADGYTLALNFGTCSTPGLQYLSLEWHELRSNGTPKDCTNHDLEDPAGTDARHNCGRVVLQPGQAATLVKLKYGKTYSFKTTAHFELGLSGPRNDVISVFTGSLAANHPATDYLYNPTVENSLQTACADNIRSPGRLGRWTTVVSGREVNYYQKDHLGTIRVVSDESGTVLSTHDYESFGLELPGQDGSSNTHRFTGHERDTETGLDYMKARYYGAGMGRFGAVDPLPGSIAVEFPVTWNRYPYTLNNPVVLVDNNGMEPNQAQAATWGQVRAAIIRYFHEQKRPITLQSLRYTEGAQGGGGQVGPFGGSSGPRYIWTEKRGWIDLAHFFQVSAEAQNHIGDGKTKAMAKGILRAGVEHELWKNTAEVENNQMKRDPTSDTVWSYEDAPSNFSGLDFFLDYYSDDSSIIRSLDRYFGDVGAADPKTAPNWKEMQPNAQKHRWFQMNMTRNPIMNPQLEKKETPEKSKDGK